MKSYQQVIKRIHGECQIIDQVINRAMHAWREASKQPDTQSLYLDAVALYLHGAYVHYWVEGVNNGCLQWGICHFQKR